MTDDLHLREIELRRRQRARNIVMLIVLAGLAALFYAIAMVRFRTG